MVKKIMLVCLFATLSIIVAGCQKEAKPDERLEEYVELWNQEKFDDMFKSYLSSETKATFKEEEFTTRYKKIYQDLEIKNINVSFKKPEKEVDWEKETNAEFSLTIAMDSLAGEIKYEEKVQLIKEEDNDQQNWYIEWQPSFILPGLEKGDKVGIKSTEAKRGEIYDRNQQPLAINGEAFEIGVVPKDFNEGDVDKLASLLGITPSFIQEQLNQSWVQPDHFVPIRKIPLSQESLALEITELLGESSLRRVEAREYPLGESAAHLTGYIGNISAEKLEELQGEGYTAQSLIGIRGAEQLFEEQLRGIEGQVIFITKESEEVITVAEKVAQDGENISLTLDGEMQKKLFEEMKGEVGTAAAIHPQTGEALSLVSTPSFDPNKFVLGISSSDYENLQSNPDNPLLTRFSTTYSPGSTMKAVTAAVGLMAGTLDPDQALEIHGKEWSDEAFGNYKVVRVYATDSSVDLESALKYSDNIYFARTGLDMGAQTFIDGLKNFGFGEEVPFTYPTKQSQISNDGTISSDVQLADSAFGQGEILMSIVHLASAYGGIINDGTMMKPVLLQDEEQGVWKENLLTKEQSDLLKENLRKVVSDGIANNAEVEGKEIAGKTGTAEIKLQQGEKGKENGLFVSYDQNDPTMVLAILLEGVEDRGGSTGTIEVAKRFYQNW
ncbi:penicillin-binding transpeptidase domain-containing protein [Bacillus spongiae]|uniref:serine-type D-Ala-D-Ala carboxypeptidase n=1 Tax=Bacillus spongiae TaxID=2683610 RepID=A0ABU8HHH7_9BACI